MADDDPDGNAHLKNYLGEGQMQVVPGQAKMGNYLGDKGSKTNMPYGPLEGVRGADGKDRFSQYPNSKSKTKP
jgi:hypothetical protein